MHLKEADGVGPDVPRGGVVRQWGEISFRTAIGDGTTNTRDLCSGVARLEAVFLEGAEYVVQAGTARSLT
jgi:hypothetical protein